MPVIHALALTPQVLSAMQEHAAGRVGYESRRASRIVLNTEDEIRFWVGLLGVSEEALRNALRQVGPDADCVSEFLSRSR